MFSLVAIPGGGAMFSLVDIVLLMVIDVCCYNTVITLHIEFVTLGLQLVVKSWQISFKLVKETTCDNY